MQFITVVSFTAHALNSRFVYAAPQVLTQPVLNGARDAIADHNRSRALAPTYACAVYKNVGSPASQCASAIILSANYKQVDLPLRRESARQLELKLYAHAHGAV